MYTLQVNGTSVAVEEDRKLIDVLRNDLGLKSVKDGCSEGACGTCTVLIDGKATKACVQKVSKMEGKSIVTVEGLSDREKEVFVYAFGEAGAVQCGFCIPGMVLAAESILSANPHPTEEKVRVGMSGNLCRCTGYNAIVNAIMNAAKEGNGLW